MVSWLEFSTEKLNHCNESTCTQIVHSLKWAMARIGLCHIIGIRFLSLFPCNRESWKTDSKIFSSTLGDDMRLFGGVKTAPLPVVVLYHIINRNQAAHQHLWKMNNRTALSILYIMCTLLIVQITCMPSLMVMLILRGRREWRAQMFLFCGSYASAKDMEHAHMQCLV